MTDYDVMLSSFSDQMSVSKICLICSHQDMYCNWDVQLCGSICHLVMGNGLLKV